MYTETVIKTKIEDSIDELYDKDIYLLKIDASERSITHHLANYLAKQFLDSDYDVDCEYNRDDCDPKKLNFNICGTDSTSEAGEKTVFPDIIVHKRGEQQNLLVIEVKKKSSRVDCKHDINKLLAFRETLNYNFAFHIILGSKRSEVEVSAP